MWKEDENATPQNAPGLPFRPPKDIRSHASPPDGAPGAAARLPGAAARHGPVAARLPEMPPCRLRYSTHGAAAQLLGAASPGAPLRQAAPINVPPGQLPGSAALSRVQCRCTAWGVCRRAGRCYGAARSSERLRLRQAVPTCRGVHCEAEHASRALVTPCLVGCKRSAALQIAACSSRQPPTDATDAFHFACALPPFTASRR
eukprot:358353-Chlamydomonas_euryale.AAC.4